jgi:hypothetical protein
MNRKPNCSRISTQASLIAGLLAGVVLVIAAPAHSTALDDPSDNRR